MGSVCVCGVAGDVGETCMSEGTVWFLWANPLGTLIRIKCLSHLFSVADRNNESLNIVLGEKSISIFGPEIAQDYSFAHKGDHSRSNFKEVPREGNGQRLVKSNPAPEVNQVPTIHAEPLLLSARPILLGFFTFFAIS